MAVTSAGINSLATAALMDFGPLFGLQAASDRQQFRWARFLTAFFGSVATLSALVISRLGTLLEASWKTLGLLGGPLLGLFFLGVLSRRANAAAALVGALAGALAGIATPSRSRSLIMKSRLSGLPSLRPL